MKKIISVILVCFMFAVAFSSCDNKVEKEENNKEKKQESIIAIESEHYEIDSKMLQSLYTQAYIDFCHEYENYIFYLTLPDTIEDLNDIKIGGTEESPNNYDIMFLGKYDGSWRDYFMDQTVDNSKKMLAFCEEATAMGIELSNAEKQEVRRSIDLAIAKNKAEYIVRNSTFVLISRKIVNIDVDDDGLFEIILDDGTVIKNDKNGNLYEISVDGKTTDMGKSHYSPDDGEIVESIYGKGVNKNDVCKAMELVALADKYKQIKCNELESTITESQLQLFVEAHPYIFDEEDDAAARDKKAKAAMTEDLLEELKEKLLTTYKNKIKINTKIVNKIGK